jgi:hypothetical protein
VNVPLGGGRRLFDQLLGRVELEQTGVSQDDGVARLEYRVVLVAIGANERQRPSALACH